MNLNDSIHELHNVWQRLKTHLVNHESIAVLITTARQWQLADQTFHRHHRRLMNAINVTTPQHAEWRSRLEGFYHDHVQEIRQQVYFVMSQYQRPSHTRQDIPWIVNMLHMESDH